MEYVVQLAINISLLGIIGLLSQMLLNEVEKVKNNIIEKELFFYYNDITNPRSEQVTPAIFKHFLAIILK